MQNSVMRSDPERTVVTFCREGKVGEVRDGSCLAHFGKGWHQLLNKYLVK